MTDPKVFRLAEQVMQAQDKMYLETDEPCVYIGTLVSEMPNPPILSTTRKCASCGEELWVAQNRAFMADTMHRISCINCAVKAARAAGEEITWLGGTIDPNKFKLKGE